MIVNPGIRRFLGSAIQRLFNSASFYATLTHSLVPERGTGSPTFTRASTATVVGYGPTDNAADGLKLLTVAANEARFVGARRISEGVWSNTFADGSLIPAATNTGYLAEVARTNLCLQSNAFTTTWANNSAAPTQNAIGPDGSTSAWTLTDSSAVATAYIVQAITLTAAAHTVSLKVKKTTGAQSSYPVILALTGTGSILSGVTVDTSNGVATPWTSFTGYTIASGVSVRCTSHNASFWQVEMTFTATAASWSFYLEPAGALTPTLATVVTDVSAQGSAVFYGAQVELGSFATPYQPTTTVAVARNADVDQYPTTDGPIAAAGSIALDFTPYHAPSGTIALWGTYVDASNYTAILHDATNLIFRKRIAGSNYDATIANAFVSGTTYKVAATWGAAGTAIYLDGVAGTPHANTTAAQIAATMQVGADGNSLQQPGAGTTNLRIWQRQLSSPEGVAVTA
jgi:hypothetical protein